MANANEFFSTLGKTLSRTANMVGRKTDEFVTVQKIRNRRNNLEEQVELSCRKIGELIYQEYSEGKEIPEELEKICCSIEEKKKEIGECREQIALVKGARLCPSCGALIPKEANYCMNCGTPSGPQKTEAEETEEAAEEKNPAQEEEE